MSDIEMVVIDGIRYRPEDAPKDGPLHKAEEAPEAAKPKPSKGKTAEG